LASENLETYIIAIEKHMEAGVLLYEQPQQDAGRASYWLFEPLLQHALLHQNIMLLHLALLNDQKKVLDAKKQLGFAKKRYDYYRNKLDTMQNELTKWRLGFVKANHTSLYDASKPGLDVSGRICHVERSTQREKGVSNIKRNTYFDLWDKIEIEYSWTDTFANHDTHGQLGISNRFSVTRRHQSRLVPHLTAPDVGSCNLEGTFSDGSNEASEVAAYLLDLKANLLTYTNSLLKPLDAAWLKLPGQICLANFKPHTGPISSSCLKVTDGTLPGKLADRFGALKQDGFWPGEQPVLTADLYFECERNAGSVSPASTPREKLARSCIREFVRIS